MQCGWGLELNYYYANKHADLFSWHHTSCICLEIVSSWLREPKHLCQWEVPSRWIHTVSGDQHLCVFEHAKATAYPKLWVIEPCVIQENKMRMKEKNFDNPSRKMSPCRNKGKREGEGERQSKMCRDCKKKQAEKNHNYRFRCKVNTRGMWLN